MLADRYELGECLGRGGMAEVHAAVVSGAHGFSRKVALKRLAPELADDPKLVRAFLDEARWRSMPSVVRMSPGYERAEDLDSCRVLE